MTSTERKAVDLRRIVEAARVTTACGEIQPDDDAPQRNETWEHAAAICGEREGGRYCRLFL
jgi:hypothetical protein